MPTAVLNPDGSVPLPGSAYPSPFGWPSLPAGLAGLRGVESYGSSTNITGEAWYVVVGSPAWDAWVRIAQPPKPVTGPKPPTYTAPGYQSAFDLGWADDGSGDVGILPIQMPAVVPPVTGSLDTPTTEAETEETACQCKAGFGSRPIWWLIFGGIVLWLL